MANTSRKITVVIPGSDPPREMTMWKWQARELIKLLKEALEA